MKKFFAALYAKLTGGDTAPKTLEAAKATFTEAKAALDKIDTLFTNAELALDELLAKGENALKDFVAELRSQLATAQASLTEANGKVAAAELKATTAEGKATGFSAQIAAFGLLFASIGYKPAEVKGKDGAAATAEETATALQDQFKAHVSAAVLQKQQELGQPAGKLPGASGAAGNGASEEDLLQQLAEAKTPTEKGRIGGALNKLRDEQRAAAHGRN